MSLVRGSLHRFAAEHTAMPTTRRSALAHRTTSNVDRRSTSETVTRNSTSTAGLPMPRAVPLLGELSIRMTGSCESGDGTAVRRSARIGSGSGAIAGAHAGASLDRLLRDDVLVAHVPEYDVIMGHVHARMTRVEVHGHMVDGRGQALHLVPCLMAVHVGQKRHVNRRH